MRERRSHERICVDAPVVCELALDDDALPVLLKDISKGGLQVEIGPGRQFMADLLGQNVTICTLPDELCMKPKGLEGIVSWQSPERLGIRFHIPLALSSAELEDIIRRC